MSMGMMPHRIINFLQMKEILALVLAHFYQAVETPLVYPFGEWSDPGKDESSQDALTGDKDARVHDAVLILPAKLVRCDGLEKP